MINVGFIGAGNMGGALMAAMKDSCHLLVYDISPKAVSRAVRECGAQETSGIEELTDKSDVIVAAVKPQYLEPVLEPLQQHFGPDKILATIVAGKTIAFWQEKLGKNVRIARIMPNTPAQVKAGMSGVCFSEGMTEEDRQTVVGLLQTAGRVEVVREELMDAVMGLSGCGPAYVYVFIEAMADAGVAEGLSRKDAYTFAAQTVLGAAKMVLETGRHPADLKDAVCSPGGTTIRGVMKLEEEGFRNAVEKAVRASLHPEA